MLDSNGTCEYVLDPDDPKTWGGEESEECYVNEEVLNEDGVWSCPHELEDGEDLCIFHLPITKKESGEVTKSFLQNIQNSKDSGEREESHLEFLGGEFQNLDLENEELTIISDDSIFSIDYANIYGSLNLSNSVFDVSNAYFNGLNCVGDAYFTNVDFKGDVHLLQAEFNRSTVFQNTIFRMDAFFNAVDFGENTYFWGAEFIGDSHFQMVQFQAIADFSDVDFGGDADFWLTEFSDDIIFSDAEFDSHVNFKFSELNEAELDKADLTDATFTKAKLRRADFESALLSRATLIGADLRGAQLNGAVLGDVRIDEDTQFLGHPDDESDSPHTFSAIRSRSRCVYDPDYEEGDEEVDVGKAKSVYRALEELAGRAARPRLQSQCFVRRQDLQKDGYKQDMKQAESLQIGLIAGARYIRAKVARATLLYGESPWRIIGGSVGFIILAALLYPLGEWLRPVGTEPITYSRIAENPELLLESLYFSTLTFTTLGMGDYEPMGFGQVLATLNTALGAVLIALLVFVLGRRAAR